MQKLLENALPEEDDDPLYKIALEVEQDTALNMEMSENGEITIADGIRGQEQYVCEGCYR